MDLNAERIAAWNANHLPIHETGLPKIVRIARDGTNGITIAGLPGMHESSGLRLPARRPNLFFSTNITPCVEEADIIFICVNTPTKTYGVGAGASADLGALESATRTIAMSAKSGAVIVEKSTVPCGTARIISDIVSFPEDLTLCRHMSLLFRPSPFLEAFFPCYTDAVFLILEIPRENPRGIPRCNVSGDSLKHTIEADRREEKEATTIPPLSTCRG